MTAPIDHQSIAIQVQERRRAHQFVSSFLENISPDGVFCTQSLLQDHPELAASKSAVLDMALEEYCRREAAGEAVDAARFAARIGCHSTSILQLLELRNYFELQCRQPSNQPIVWPEAGDELLGFVFLEELGRGALSRVYLASQVEIADRAVVVKIVPSHESEVGILGRLIHPNIVPIHSVQVDGERGLSAICMPYLGQTTLFDVLLTVRDRRISSLQISSLLAALPIPEENGSIPAKVAARLPNSYSELVIQFAVQLADALAYTHEQGICHYDIKPSNILMSDEGTVRLIDFNLAAAHAERGSIGGTLPYMSPEQLQRHFGLQSDRPIGTASDVFSLGVVLYELLTGIHPFSPTKLKDEASHAATELLERQRTTRPLIRTRNPTIDRGLESTILRCLSFDPENRPSAVNLHRDLLRATCFHRRSLRWMLLHRRPLQSLSAIIATAGLGLGWYWSHLDPPDLRAAHLGIARQQQGNYQDAEQHFDRSLALQPLKHELWFLRGLCRLEMNRPKDAYSDFVEANRLKPDSRSAAYAGYCLCLMERDWKLAITYLETAKELGLHETGLENDLAYCYLMIGNLDQCEQTIQPCINRIPATGQSFSILSRLHVAQALLAKGRRQHDQTRTLLQQALVELQQALAQEYENAEVHLDRARIEVLLAADEAILTPATVERINECLRSAYRWTTDFQRLDERIQELKTLLPRLNDKLELPPRMVHVPSPQMPQTDLPLLAPFWPRQPDFLSAKAL